MFKNLVKKIKVIKNPKGNLYKMISKKDNFLVSLEKCISQVHQKNLKVGRYIKKEHVDYSCKWIS